MDDPDFKELEQFIQTELKKLPERDAPADLIGNVFKSIAAEKAKNWWQRPFNCWPTVWQGVFMAGLVVCCGSMIYLASALIGQISVTASAWAQSSANPALVCYNLMATMLNAAWLAISSFNSSVYLVLAGIAASLYLGCIASGVALYKIAFHRNLQVS